MGEKTGCLNLAVPRWARHEHPVFWLESRRQARNRGLVTIQGAFLPILFGLVGLTIPMMMVIVIPSFYGFSGLESNIELLIMLEIIVLACIQLGAGAIVNVLTVALAAPLISGEIELQSWRLLRTTMVPLREIVFAKLTAVLYELRTMLVGLFVLRLISTGTAVLFFAYVMVRQTVYDMSLGGLKRFLLGGEWVPYVILITAIALYNLSQPGIQAVMNGMLGMATSSYARSRSQAIAAGLVGRLIVWVGTTLLNAGLIFGLVRLLDNLSFLAEEQITWVTCLTISVYLLGFLLVQIGFILALMGAVLRRTRHLGV